MIITLQSVCGMIPVTTVAIGLVNTMIEYCCWQIHLMFGTLGCIIINKYSHNEPDIVSKIFGSRCFA